MTSYKELGLVNDPRRAVQIPQEVIAAGLEANPRNN